MHSDMYILNILYYIMSLVDVSNIFSMKTTSIEYKVFFKIIKQRMNVRIADNQENLSSSSRIAVEKLILQLMYNIYM